MNQYYTEHIRQEISCRRKANSYLWSTLRWRTVYDCSRGLCRVGWQFYWLKFKAIPLPSIVPYTPSTLKNPAHATVWFF